MNANERKPIARNRFEEIGCRLQENAESFEEMKQCFDGSCMRCSLRKRTADCAACPIRETFLALADESWHRMKAADYLYVEMERASV